MLGGNPGGAGACGSRRCRSPPPATIARSAPPSRKSASWPARRAGQRRGRWPARARPPLRARTPAARPAPPIGRERRAAVGQPRDRPRHARPDRRGRFFVDLPAGAFVDEQPADERGCPCEVGLPAVGDDRLRARERDRGEGSRPAPARAARFLRSRSCRSAAAPPRPDCRRARRRSRRAGLFGVEGDAEQVAAEVQRRRRVFFPQARFPAPQPHLAVVADRVGAVGRGPGDRAQARRRSTRSPGPNRLSGSQPSPGL